MSGCELSLFWMSDLTASLDLCVLLYAETLLMETGREASW